MIWHFIIDSKFSGICHGINPTQYFPAQMIWSDRFSTWLCVKCEHERWWWWWIIYARIRGSPSAKPFKTLPRFALGVYIFHIISHLSDRATEEYTKSYVCIILSIHRAKKRRNHNRSRVNFSTCYMGNYTCVLAQAYVPVEGTYSCNQNVFAQPGMSWFSIWVIE